MLPTYCIYKKKEAYVGSAVRLRVLEEEKKEKQKKIFKELDLDDD